MGTRVMKHLRVSDIALFAILAGALGALLWFGVLEPHTTAAEHEFECRAIRSDFLSAPAGSTARAQFDSKFNATDCKGSLLNTFLKAGS